MSVHCLWPDCRRYCGSPCPHLSEVERDMPKTKSGIPWFAPWTACMWPRCFCATPCQYREAIDAKIAESDGRARRIFWRGVGFIVLGAALGAIIWLASQHKSYAQRSRDWNDKVEEQEMKELQWCRDHGGSKENPYCPEVD
jgi:hypothetical protein